MPQLDTDPPIYPYLCIYPPRHAGLVVAQDVEPPLAQNSFSYSELGVQYPSFNLCRFSCFLCKLEDTNIESTWQTPRAIQVILCVFIRQLRCPDQLVCHHFRMQTDHHISLTSLPPPSLTYTRQLWAMILCTPVPRISRK